MTDPWLLRFVVRRITYTLTDFGFEIVCYTNNPCHLFLRYTKTRPQRHIHARTVRGAPVGTYIDQCFVNYHDNEQEEAGDTYTHTFLKEPWPYCETRWLYFWGTVDGNLSPSKTCIFQKHQDDETLPMMELLILEPWTVDFSPPSFESVIIEPWTS